MKKAIFLDRDGVINKDSGYVHAIEDFHFLPGVFEALRTFEALGYLLIIVTNQSGIGRGYYTQKDFETLTDWMKKELQKRDIHIAGVYHCPHHPDDGCGCRKPQPGLILQAAKDFDVDLSRSWMIGDKQSDIEAAKNAGIQNAILLGEGEAPYHAKTLFDTIKIIEFSEKPPLRW